jgi:hypothetical protein
MTDLLEDSRPSTEGDGKAEAQIKLTRLDKRVLEVPIRGLSPLIPHKWSEKSLKMMRDKQSGAKARPKKEPKDPVAEAEGATYYLEDGRVGMPATAFKAAIVGAARYFDGITLVQTREAFFVVGEVVGDGVEQLVAIEYPDGGRVLREDTPRVTGGNPDLRYRYAYWPWGAILPVRYNPVLIDTESVIALVDAAGQGWRRRLAAVEPEVQHGLVRDLRGGDLMAVRKIALADLVEDFGVYPRHAVDDSHVHYLAEALRAGATLPPPVADSETKRLVDGFHTSRAHRAVYGAETSLKVDLRDYADDAALVRDAVARNSIHGRKLDSQDRVRSALMMQRLGVETHEIAITLQVTEAKVSSIVAKVVLVEGEKRPAKPSQWSNGGEPRELTEQQYTVHQSSPGVRHSQTMRQLARELRAGLVQEKDREAAEDLHRSARRVAVGAGP